jgi:DeoR/GlpR family transcriptional regulator of sugar metabolism
MKLGPNQRKVLELLRTDSYTIPELAEAAGISQSIVKNIITELYDAELVRKTEAGVVSLKDKLINSKHIEEVNEWKKVQIEYRPVLKNLSRIV